MNGELQIVVVLFIFYSLDVKKYVKKLYAKLKFTKKNIALVK